MKKTKKVEKEYLDIIPRTVVRCLGCNDVSADHGDRYYNFIIPHFKKCWNDKDGVMLADIFKWEKIK